MWSSSSSRGGWHSPYDTAVTARPAAPYSTVSVSSMGTPSATTARAAKQDLVEERKTTESWTTTKVRGGEAVAPVIAPLVVEREKIEEPRPASSSTTIIRDHDWRGGVEMTETWDSTSARRVGSYSTASTLEKTRELDDEPRPHEDGTKPAATTWTVVRSTRYDEAKQPEPAKKPEEKDISSGYSSRTESRTSRWDTDLVSYQKSFIRFRFPSHVQPTEMTSPVT
ncbi:unnamed protein product [Anisakis simplex]|uniref:Uncharacterized protein n=1 Tax=Anisakis simplex TaxID=6269 RepID=A0A0M3KH33_ANISI|nr:unnamed protein product [Anisakis simplex]